MSDCVVCTTLEAPGRSRDMWIFEDDLVLLGHIGPTPGREDGYPGQMLLVPRRHVTSPAGLTRAEAERIGLWLSRGAGLLESVRGAEHVYLWRLGDGWPHVHFHLVPRYPGTPEEYYGLAVRDWPGVRRYGWEGLAAIASELRRAAAALG
jgi:diadenosine tetraphosphate (Ap4A) HIT family hydrolase